MSASGAIAMLAWSCALAVLGGCATVDPAVARRDSGESTVFECAEWFRSLDAAIDSAGVRDVQAARVAGFPYLRVDRFSAALRETARDQETALDALLERLAGLDLEARAHEIANLTQPQLKAAWDGIVEPDVETALTRTRECGSRMRVFDVDSREAGQDLLARLEVPDDYVLPYRVLGLYPLAKIPFAIGVRKHEEAVEAAFARDLETASSGPVVRFSPASRPRMNAEKIGDILERGRANPLRVPAPSEDELGELFALYAPSFEIETRDDYDRPGALRWRWGDVPEVDSADTAVYRNVAYTRYRGYNLLQLVYTIWFSQRPPQSRNDLLAGTLDGVVFRVTLSPDGTPLVYDTMHPCGCYHMFFPTSRALPRPAPAGEAEWAFIPQKLPVMNPADRVVVRIASSTHYVERVYRDRDDSLARYELRPYDELRSMRRMRGGQASVFGADGIVAGTERAERFLFWPMGVRSAGAMRQWGHHATAFIGRRHFDDADLFERRFELDLK